MFVRLGKFLGNFLYWIGWGLAVLLIGIAIILSITLRAPADCDHQFQLIATRRSD